MKKSTRNVLIVVIIILFILCLFSFNVNGIKRLFNKSNMRYAYGVEEAVDDMEYDYAVTETSAARIAPMVNYSAKQMSVNGTLDIPADLTGVDEEQQERKIIKYVNLNCETQDYDRAYELVERKVQQYNGVIDSESFNNNKFNNKIKRYCYFTIKIPKDNVDYFVNEISQEVNVLSKDESLQDVTDNYYDTVTRLKNYKLEEEKLQELMKKTTKVDELVTIEERLHNVRVEIENIERRVKNLDKKIDYSTVNISLEEVVVYSRPEDVKPTKEGLMAAFKKNFEDTKNFIINTGYYIFTHIPAICLVISAGVLLIIIVIVATALFDGIGKKKIIKPEKNNTVKEEIKQEDKNDTKQEDKKVKTDAKKDNKNYVKLSSALENNYTDLNTPAPKPSEIKKDDSGFTMADLDFTSTK